MAAQAAPPENHGHRGARGLYPENSLKAIRAGIENDCDAIEVDLCISADDQVVIHHDPVLASYLVRDNTGRWIDREILIRELSLGQIKQFDVGRIDPGSKYAERFPDQVAIDGTRIPTLTEFVDLTERLKSNVVFNLELKSTPYDLNITPDVTHYIDLVLTELKRHQIVDRTFLQSFDWRLMIEAKRILPKLKIGLLTDQQLEGNPLSPIAGQPTRWTCNQDLADFNHGIPELIKSLNADVWSSNQLDLTLGDVQHAHDLGLEVYAWTVNEVSDMNRMIDIGVDAITTDYPNVLNDLLN